MTITNKTNIILTVIGKEVKPGQTRDYPPRYDTGITVSSDIGECRIFVKDGRVLFTSTGKLVAKYGMKKDKRGHKSVNIYANV